MTGPKQRPREIPNNIKRLLDNLADKTCTDPGCIACNLNHDLKEGTEGGDLYE